MTRISIQEFTIEHAKSESYIKWLNDNEVTQFLGRDDMQDIKERCVGILRRLKIK